MKKIVCMMLIIVVAINCVACKGTNESSKNDSTGKTSVESAGGGSDNSSKDNSSPIKIAVTPWNPCMFLNLAEELGYFDEVGVNVDLVDFAEFNDVPTAFNAGQIDGAFFSSFEVIAPASLGVDLKVVAVADNSVGADGLLASSEYTTLEELKGHTIGVGLDTISHIYLLLLLEEEGYLADDFELVDMSASARATALITGQIDATAVFEPFISSILSEGDDINVISDTSVYPKMINDCIAFSGAAVENRREDIVKIMTCWYKAIEYWENNTEEATEIMAGLLEVTPEDFVETMTKLEMVSAEDCLEQLTPSDSADYWGNRADTISTFLLERGMIKNEVDGNSCLDNSIVQSILEQE